MQQATTNRMKRVLKTLGFTVLAVVIFFLLCEALLRVVGFSAYQIDFSVYPNVPGDIVPNQRLIHRVPQVDIAYSITINDQGFRGSGKATPTSFYRILCLGDSSTMGYGVGDHASYPERLESFLDGIYSGVFDVINAGTIGYTIDDELSYLREKGLRLAPDLVVLELFYNDVIEKQHRQETQRKFRRKRVSYTPLKSLLLNSAFYQALRNTCVRIMAAAGHYFPENPTDKMPMAMFPAKFPEAWEAYDRVLREFIELLRERHIPLIAIISPHQYQVYKWGYPFGEYYGTHAYQDHLKQLLAGEEIACVDLLPEFLKQVEENKALYLTYGLYDEHLSDIGQLVKAELVFAAIQRQLAKEGFYNFYDQLDNAEITTRSLTAFVKYGRRWISRGDERSLIMAGNATVRFPNIMIQPQSQLVFGIGVPRWSAEQVAEDLEFEIILNEEGSTQSVSLFHWIANKRKDTDEEPPHIIALAPYAGKRVAIEFLTTTAEMNRCEIYLSNPMIICGEHKPAFAKRLPEVTAK